MKQELLVNVSPRETRAALVENGVVLEVHLERASCRGLVSNIYKGCVSRVLPGMQAAFIEIGLQRTAFLHASDIVRRPSEGNSFESAGEEPIRDLVKEGSELLVQVIKDPLGTKGARLTTFITLPSRYLVFMPRGGGIGVSSRIENEDERNRLRDIVEQFVTDAGGYILRTAAEGTGHDAIRADMLFLQKLWDVIRGQARDAKLGSRVYEDLALPLRLLRDSFSEDMERVRVDDLQVEARMKQFTDQFIPEMTPRIEEYSGERPIFDLYSIDDEIEKALERKVSLKSGGYLIFDQTEAMTTVDVNTGAYVGHRNLEETIFRTNLEAAVAISRHLRLRNLGGIIIIDFIDMEQVEHREQVLLALDKNLAADRARTQISQVSPLGLVEMTRKRTTESLEHVLCRPCPICDGRGSVKTPETVCYDIFREILSQTRQFEFQQLLVLAHQEVIERMLDEESASLAELEETTGKPIRLQAEALYAEDQYDVVLM